MTDLAASSILLANVKTALVEKISASRNAGDDILRGWLEIVA